jgi:hypothetical protein
MRNYKLLLVCLVAVGYASATSTDAHTQQAAGSFAIDAQSPSGVKSRSPIVPTPIKHLRTQMLRSNFPNIKGGVVKEMRATSAFVQREAAKTGTLDDWLIVLAAFGLIVLQLRHKHKSLPQRRITPYG